MYMHGCPCPGTPTNSHISIWACLIWDRAKSKWSMDKQLRVTPI